MPNDAIDYQFSRSKEERGGFSHSLGLYAPDKLPTGRRLREMMDALGRRKETGTELDAWGNR